MPKTFFLIFLALGGFASEQKSVELDVPRLEPGACEEMLDGVTEEGVTVDIPKGGVVSWELKGESIFACNKTDKPTGPFSWTVTVTMDQQEKSKTSEVVQAPIPSEKKEEKKGQMKIRVVRLGGDSDEGVLVTRHFKTILLPRIKAGRCASVDAGISIRSGDRVSMYIDEGRDAVVWALQEMSDGGVGIEVCNNSNQDQLSEAWPVMLFVRR